MNVEQPSNQSTDLIPFNTGGDATPITNTVRQIASILHRVTGLQDLEELTCAYYCLITYFVDKINPFPLLNTMGPNGSGKTSLLQAFSRLSYRPHMFTALNMTPPSMRDELGLSHDGTVIIDEADTDKLEQYLTMRYLRETALCYVKVPAGPGGWKTRIIPIFGPSIVHKRVPFKDPAVDGRSILINTIADTNRHYVRIEDISEDEIMGTVIAQMKLKFTIKIPSNPTIPDGIAPRVADSYKPLIALASIENDNAFLEPLWERLRLATIDFTDGQSYEPGPLVVQALLSCLTKDEKLVISNVSLEGELVKKIQYEFGENLNSRQIAKILRNYGFTLTRIGGPFSVIPDLKTLVKVTRAIGLDDEALKKAAENLKVDPWELE